MLLQTAAVPEHVSQAVFKVRSTKYFFKVTYHLSHLLTVLVKLGVALKCVKKKTTWLSEGVNQGGSWLKGTMGGSNGQRRGTTVFFSLVIKYSTVF